VVIVTSDLFDISVAASEQVLFNAVTACEVLEAGLIWNEATSTSTGPGDITIGTSTGGAELVAITAYDVSQSSGAYQALVLKAAGVELAAGTSIFASHDTATSDNGTYFLQLKIRVEV
jgi:hypothetical protein